MAAAWWGEYLVGRHTAGRADQRADEFAEFQQVMDRSLSFTVKHTFCPEGTLPMWVADMDLPVDPAVHAAILERARHPCFGYTIQPPELWASAAAWMRREHGWLSIEPDHFLFCPNLVSATVNAIRAFTEPGDGVALVRPLYTPLQSAVTAEGRRLVAVDARSQRGRGSPLELDLAVLRAVLAAERPRALIWCSPHNPSGRVWSRDELRAVAAMCDELDVFIIADEVWADLTLFGARHTPMALACADVGHARVLTASSPNKTWNLAGLHVGFVVLQSAPLRARYLEVVEHTHARFGSVFATTAMLAAYQHGGPWRERARRYFESQVELVEAFLGARVPEIAPSRPQASYLVWLDCSRLGLDALVGGARSELCLFLEQEARVKLSDGWSYGGEATAQYQRINVACSRAILVEALERIAAAVERRRGQSRGSAGN